MKLITLILAGLLLATPAHAQHELKVGDRVRLTTAGSPLSPVTGTVVGSDNFHITILARERGAIPRECTIEWNALTRIELSKGNNGSKAGSYAVRGFVVGLLAGIGAGAIIGNSAEGGESPGGPAP